MSLPVFLYLVDILQRELIHFCMSITLQWRHNGLDGVSNHQPHHCLLSRLFGRRSKKTSKLRVTGLCAGNSSGTGEFPAQMASNAENVSIWWRHHERIFYQTCCQCIVKSTQFQSILDRSWWNRKWENTLLFLFKWNQTLGYAEIWCVITHVASICSHSP